MDYDLDPYYPCQQCLGWKDLLDKSREENKKLREALVLMVEIAKHGKPDENASDPVWEMYHLQIDYAVDLLAKG